METGAHGAGLKRAIVAALLALAFAVGYDAGARADRPAAPAISDGYVPSGPALWRTLPPEMLANVEEGIQERISELEDELVQVREMMDNPPVSAER